MTAQPQDLTRNTTTISHGSEQGGRSNDLSGLVWKPSLNMVSFMTVSADIMLHLSILESYAPQEIWCVVRDPMQHGMAR